MNLEGVHMLLKSDFICLFFKYLFFIFSVFSVRYTGRVIFGGIFIQLPPNFHMLLIKDIGMA